MRVTNQMVTSGSLRNMQKSMQHVSKLNQQVTTGKKISAPSEDPVIAIRALKLRTTCDQLDQYKNKNIKDAMSWVDTTQTSVQNVYDRLQDVYYYCEQGASDTFQTKDRQTIIDELNALKDAIYKEGGMTYAGRYLFSGYKTETNLIFQDDAAKEGLSYNITEDIDPKTIISKNVVLDGIKPEQLDDILAGNTTYQKPTSASVYKMRLAYSGIDNGMPNITVTDANGNQSDLVAQLGANFTVKQVADSDTYYAVDPDGVNYIPETGEVIMGENVYNQIKNAQTVSVNYDKSKFAVGDLRPEMYFNCHSIRRWQTEQYRTQIIR